LNNTKKLY